MYSEQDSSMEISNTSSSDGVLNKLPVEIQMCRFCGKVGSDGSTALIRLHYPTEHQAVIRNIRRELLECWKVKFYPNDGLPKHICQSCYLEFDSYFSFRDNYLESQSTLCSIYEDMQEKEIQKSLHSTMEEPSKKQVTTDELHQRKMLHCITNDHNYLGSYEDFLKISTGDRIEQKLWRLKARSNTNINKSFERNDENFTCQAEGDYDRLQYDRELFSDTEQFQAVKEIESEKSIESQNLFDSITDSVELTQKNIENQSIELTAEEEIKSEKSIEDDDTIENQSLFKDITDSVEVAQKNIELQSITFDGNEYEVKNVFNKFYPEHEQTLETPIQREPVEQITYLVELRPDSIENYLKLDTNKWKLQTDSIQSSTDDFEHLNVIRSPQEANVSQTEKIIETQIQSEFDKQKIDAVEYGGDDFDKPIDRRIPLKSESDKNQLNVTIFMQNKTMGTQMTSEIEEQILNLVETKEKCFGNVDVTKSVSNPDTNEFIVDHLTHISFLKQEETIETQVQANFEGKTIESGIDNFEDNYVVSIPIELDSSDCNIKSLMNKSILTEEETVEAQIQVEFDELRVDSRKSEGDDFEIELGNKIDFPKIRKKKRNRNRLPFSCKFCVSDPDLLSKKERDNFSTEEALAEHFRIEHDIEFPYSCLICKKKFKQYTSCRRHVFYTHKKPNVVCEICGVEFPTVKISEHMERSHTIGDYKCEICRKKFKNISLTKFKYHQKWHNQEQQLKCTFCNKNFVQQSHLQEHITEQHTKDYKIMCEICGAGFSVQFKKYVHMAKMHGELKPIKCLYCDQRFLGYKLRLRHMIAFHDHIHNTSNERSICLICKKIFGNERGLSIHESIGCSGLATHDSTIKNLHSCSTCPRQFKSKATLTRHYKFHIKEGRPFQCELCSLNYETKLDLLNHKCIQFPHKEEPLRERRTVYEAPACTKNLHDHNYSFKTSVELDEDKKLFEDIKLLDIPEGSWIIPKIENSFDNDSEAEFLSEPLRSDSSKFRCDEVLFSDSEEFEKDESNDFEIKMQSTVYPTSYTNEPVKTSTEPAKIECTIENQIKSPTKEVITESNEFDQDDFNFKKVRKKPRLQISRLPYLCKFCVYDPDLITEASQISHKSDEELKEHIRTQHDPELPYSCVICKKNYKKYTACRRHVFYLHIKPTVVCEVCGIECNTTKISQHILRFHTIGDYKCEICQKEFKNTSLTNFKYHQRWHDTTLQYKCNMCDRAFIQPAHLKVHQMEKHTKDFKIKCVKCGEGFSSQYKKNIHMTKMHGELQPLKCTYCDQRFKNYESRRRHLIVFHDDQTKDAKVKCITCKNIFRSDLGLKIHQSNGCKGKFHYEESTDKVITCSICPRKFKNKRALSKHFKFHSMEGRPYPCDRCYLNFKTKLESLKHKCTQVGKYLDEYLN